MISRRDMLLGRFLGRRNADDADASAAAPGASSIGAVHRPPGAVDEPAFLAGCTRCGDCITACPVDAIIIADARAGTAAGTPVINPTVSPCVMCEDTPCITACEPGVLSHDAPLRMGTASIRAPHCIAHNGTTCTVCSERCPVEGAVSVVNGRPVINEETCTGCGVCQYVCPAPYNAVLILPRSGEGKLESPEPTDPAAFDWRGAYFKNRSLRPPEG